jgi:hypothetical protein
MKKRISSLLLVFCLCLSLLTVAAGAAGTPDVSGAYANGVVTVSGTSFSANTAYSMIAVKDSTDKLIALGSAQTDEEGTFSVGITTGAVSTPNTCKVYVYNDIGGAVVAYGPISETGVTTHTITASAGSGGTISPSGSVAVNDGESQTFTIAANSGYSISAVTVDETSAGAISTYTFSNVTANHTIAATFTYNGGGGTGGGGSSSGSTTTSGTTSTTVTGTTDSSGKTAASVTTSAMSNLVDAAKNAEANGKEAVVEIKMETSSATKSAALTIPAASFSNLAKNTDAAVMIDAGIASVTFNADAVDSINSAAGAKDISIAIAAVNTSALSAEAQQLVGGRPVYDFTVTAGGSTISSFGGGSAAISVPYTLQTGEDANAIVVYYIDSTGALQSVRGAYNSSTESVDFVASHFSQYAVGYNMVSFADVSTADWYYAPVTFCAARGITAGTTATTFSPNATVTRGQFIVMLLRAYGIEPDSNPSSNFADAGNTYYTNYLAKAKDLGISAGVGNNLFAPDQQITRQEMFTLLYRALNVLDELPAATSSKTLSSFSDAASVSDYAKDAMTALVQGGVIAGSDGKLNPQGQSSRAQMVQVLYNLLSR